MYNTIYDATYAGLSALMALILLVTAVRGTRQGAAASDPSRRTQASAIALAAVGVLAALVAGVGLNAVRSSTGDLVYQQVHFAVFYVGFGLVLLGADRVASDDRPVSPTFPSAVGWRRWRRALWSVWAVATAIAGAFLVAAGAGAQQTPGVDRRVPQEPIYYLPMLVAALIVAIGLLGLAERLTDPGWRRRVLIWLGLFGCLMFLGLLREATIIPTTNEPLVDLLLAFGPFAAATLCLYEGLQSAIAGADRSPSRAGS